MGPDPKLFNARDHSGVNQRVPTSQNPGIKLQRRVVMTTRTGVKRCEGGGWGRRVTKTVFPKLPVYFAVNLFMEMNGLN